jgi:hypothetical protein
MIVPTEADDEEYLGKFQLTEGLTKFFPMLNIDNNQESNGEQSHASLPIAITQP